MKLSLTLSLIVASMVLVSCGGNTQNNETPVNTGSVQTTDTDNAVDTTTDTDASESTTTGEPVSYRSIETYRVPSGPAEVEFLVELNENGSVVNVDATWISSEDDDVTPVKVAEFNEAIDHFVVEKPLSALADLDVVGGASLTTDAFKQYVSTLN